MGTVSRKTAQHYNWGGKCEGWHLAKSETLSVIEERVPPGCSETRHHHDRSEQFFYVLSGEAMMELEGEAHKLTPGEGIHVPPGYMHRLFNDGSDELHFLVVSTPPSHGDRVDG
jgi:mannose-6-phosphate isomerase-like protein (cupin superfamily)